MRHLVLAGLALTAAPALAQPAGAPVAAPTQPGAWGPGGWQHGAASAPVAAPAPVSAPVVAPVADAPLDTPVYTAAPPVQPARYRPIVPGDRVKGPALGNTVYDWRRWGLGAPGPAMRWIRWYDEAVMIDARDRAVDARRVVWNTLPRAVAPTPAYAAYPQPPQRAPGKYVTRDGDTVTTTEVMAPPATVGQAWGGYGQVVSATPGTIVTTTRSYTVTEPGSTRARRRARR